MIGIGHITQLPFLDQSLVIEIFWLLEVHHPKNFCSPLGSFTDRCAALPWRTAVALPGSFQPRGQKHRRVAGADPRLHNPRRMDGEFKLVERQPRSDAAAPFASACRIPASVNQAAMGARRRRPYVSRASTAKNSSHDRTDQQSGGQTAIWRADKNAVDLVFGSVERSRAAYGNRRSTGAATTTPIGSPRSLTGHSDPT